MTRLEIFNETLSSLKNSFHKYGKFSDSNAKLDEIGKIFSIFLYEKKYNDSRNIINSMLKEFQFNKKGFLLQANEKFKKIAQHEVFALTNGHSIFGENPSLDLDMNDDSFSYIILKLINETHNKLSKSSENFDFLNEVFGYFIRDNFRSNIEDAQYMTPQEVVDFICRIAKSQIDVKKNLIVCDPSCGVGSFLRTFAELFEEKERLNIKFIGQDKVPRMSRLSKMNLSLIENVESFIAVGNSIIGESYLDAYKGKIDLILTNPPFGAKFTNLELNQEEKSKYPLLSDLFEKNCNINSEILFLDRYLGLLNDGGHLFVVLPDSVISSNGIQEILRYRISKSIDYEIKSIIELPVETFAQAGTRTKTSILQIVKKPKQEINRVFIAKSNNIGFEVSNRRGVTVKKEIEQNDLNEILNSFKIFNSVEARVALPYILNEEPSCVEIDSEILTESPWTPNHYDANKIKSIQNYTESTEFDLFDITDFLRVITKERNKEKRDPNSKCISVLHVVNGDLLDYNDLIHYNPKYQGIVCKPGDLLFSKINPRIHRTLVVPNLDFPLSCSSEFEILESIGEFNNFEMKIILGLPSVKKQLSHLTSGTSSSHNRIKTIDFLKIKIPLPKKGTSKYNKFKENLKNLEIKYKLLSELNIEKIKISNNLIEEVYF